MIRSRLSRSAHSAAAAAGSVAIASRHVQLAVGEERAPLPPALGGEQRVPARPGVILGQHAAHRRVGVGVGVVGQPVPPRFCPCVQPGPLGHGQLVHLAHLGVRRPRLGDPQPQGGVGRCGGSQPPVAAAQLQEQLPGRAPVAVPAVDLRLRGEQRGHRLAPLGDVAELAPHQAGEGATAAVRGEHGDHAHPGDRGHRAGHPHPEAVHAGHAGQRGAVERAQGAVEFEAGEPVGAGPRRVRPAVERLLVHVLERGQLIFGDRADLERVAMLAFLPAGGSGANSFSAPGRGRSGCRAADLRGCQRTPAGGLSGAAGWGRSGCGPLTCAGASDPGGRIQCGHHGCPWSGPSPARRALRLAHGEAGGWHASSSPGTAGWPCCSPW